MFIAPSVDDGDELFLCLLSCWLRYLSSRKEAYVKDSMGEGQYVLRSLKTIVVRREQLKNRSTYFSLLVDLQSKRLDAIDHEGNLKTMRQGDSD